MASDAFSEHRIYVQNLASMIPPLVLDAQPGERILDLGAAPGSKTLQLACLMRNTGEIAAVEIVKRRFYKLRANLEAQGATNVRPFLRDGATVWRHRPEHFDRVLLDAPCSTEGRFRTDDPATYAYWSPRKIKEMARKQRRLLHAFSRAMRAGPPPCPHCGRTITAEDLATVAQKSKERLGFGGKEIQGFQRIPTA